MNNIGNAPIKRTKQKERQSQELATSLVFNLCRPLRDLQKRNEDIEHINYKIYHLLTRPYTFTKAQINLRLDKGIDQFETTQLHFGQGFAIKIAEDFKKQKYSFKTSRRTWTPQPGKKAKRPIDTPTQRDRIVQEAIRKILECIYEPEFKSWDKNTKKYASNFGFRKGLGCWDAMYNIRTKAQGTTWVIEGNFDKPYDSIDHNILISVLSRRIKDKKFLSLLKNLLSSGIMEKNAYEETLMDIPQVGRLSPLLFNIYMFEFDKWVYESFIKQIVQNKTKKFSPKYSSLTRQIQLTSKRLKQCGGKLESKELTKKIRYLRSLRNSFHIYEPSTIPKYASFTRYADVWVLCLTCSHREALYIKDQIKIFSVLNLKMKLNIDRTLVTHISK